MVEKVIKQGGLAVIFTLVVVWLVTWAAQLSSYWLFAVLSFALLFPVVITQVVRQTTQQQLQKSHVIYGAVVLILALVLNMVAPEDLDLEQRVLATLLVLVCGYPMWRYLRNHEASIPLVPFISIIYAIYFAFPVFAPVLVYFRFTGIVAADSNRAAVLVALLGVSAMLIAYYVVTDRPWRGWIPQFRTTEWSVVRARNAAVVIGLIGFMLQVNNSFLSLIPGLSAVFQLLGQFSLLAIAILLYLQLQGDLTLPYKIFLWGLIVPMQLLGDIASGFLYYAFRDAFLMLMVYLLVRKRIPWAILVVGVGVGLIFLFSKAEYRKLTWYGNQDLNILSKAKLYLDVAGDQFTSVGQSDDGEDEVRKLVNRLDYRSTLAYVIQATPDIVPYWGGETYVTVIYKPIPRFLWPDKPSDNTGQTFGHRYGLLEPTDYTTSYNMPQLVELFANFGYAGVIFGMAIIGLLYNMLRFMLEPKDMGDWGKLTALVVYAGLLHIDSSFMLVFGNVAYWIILCYLLGRFIFPTQQRRGGLHLTGRRADLRNLLQAGAASKEVSA